MPLPAVVTLHAHATDTGVLRAVVALPNLLFGMLAGAWIDRLPRRRVLIVAQLLSAAVLATIPLATIAHRLVLAQLFTVAFLSATAGVFGNLAASAFLPALVGRSALVDANSKLATSASTLSIVGPGVAGFLVQIGVGPALTLGALSFGVGWTLAPLAAGPPPVATAILMVGQFLLWGGSMVANINIGSLRQAMTPDRLLGRVNGSSLFVFQGVVPIRALTGGLVGEALGLRVALALAAAGTLVAMVVIAASPLRRVRTLTEVPRVFETGTSKPA
jgi:hypothetical protein